MCAVYRRVEGGPFYMNFTLNGQRVFKSTGKNTKKEAKHVEAMERQKLMEEEKLTPQQKSTKISEAIDQVYQARWKKNKDGKGSYNKATKFITLIGDLTLECITDDIVYDYIEKLEATGVKLATVNRHLTALKTVLRFKKQTSDFIRLAKEHKGRIRVISKEEELKIVKIMRSASSCKRQYFYIEVADLIEILVDTGMRLSEAINTKYEDINFSSNLISIWKNKTEKPRSIPMTDRVKRILESRVSINGVGPFTITKHQAGHAWNWVRKVMGMKDDKEFVIHSLRHTCASRLVNKGVDLYVVKEYLGHSSIQVTERYAHLAPNKLAHATAILNSYVQDM